MYERKQYLEKLISKRDNGRVKIITGMLNKYADALNDFEKNNFKESSERFKWGKIVETVVLARGFLFNA